MRRIRRSRPSWGCNAVTVGKWRTRFAEKRLDGLLDEPRPGQPRKITDELVEKVIVTTLETVPDDGSTHWSTRSLAAKVGLNQTAVSRIWRTFGLKPHRIEDFKLSTDPQFIDKVRDVVGLYVNPPDAAVALCVDEKTQVQALDRTAPVLPMLPGTPARQSYTYICNGTSDLYAALDIASGKVITQMTDQHRAVEFRAFGPQRPGCARDLRQRLHPQGAGDPTLVGTAPPLHDALHADLQLVAEPGRTLVLRTHNEEATARDPPLRRLRRDITNWVDHWNENPRPFIWRKTADWLASRLNQPRLSAADAPAELGPAAHRNSCNPKPGARSLLVSARSDGDNRRTG
jgi:hypothetical protein